MPLLNMASELDIGEWNQGVPIEARLGTEKVWPGWLRENLCQIPNSRGGKDGAHYWAPSAYFACQEVNYLADGWIEAVTKPDGSGVAFYSQFVNGELPVGTYTFSCWAKNPNAQSAKLTLDDPAITLTIPPNGGVATRYSATGTTVYTSGLISGSTPYVANARIQFRDVLIEAGSTLGSYFDGASANSVWKYGPYVSASRWW